MTPLMERECVGVERLQWRREEKEIGIAAAVAIETTRSDRSATDASSPAFSSMPKLPPIPNGFLALVTGFAPVTLSAFPSFRTRSVKFQLRTMLFYLLHFRSLQ